MLSATSFEISKDRSNLHKHVQQCADARGQMHRLRCTVEAFDALLAPRFLTTIVAMTIPMLVILALLS